MRLRRKREEKRKENLTTSFRIFSVIGSSTFDIDSNWIREEEEKTEKVIDTVAKVSLQTTWPRSIFAFPPSGEISICSAIRYRSERWQIEKKRKNLNIFSRVVHWLQSTMPSVHYSVESRMSIRKKEKDFYSSIDTTLLLFFSFFLNETVCWRQT